MWCGIPTTQGAAGLLGGGFGPAGTIARGSGCAHGAAETRENGMPKHDPRDEAEQARADLKANEELGLAPPESPVTRRPAVTPRTFGVSDRKATIAADEAGDPGAPASSEDALSRARE
jgi:hypothetical protein